MGYDIKKSNIASFLLFITTLLFLIFLLIRIQYSYPGIIGYDGYYHIKMAKVMYDNGIFFLFSSLIYIPFGKNFVDHHFLYHILLIPFSLLFGLMEGAKISAIFFDFLFLIVLASILKKLSVKNIPIWLLVFFSLSSTFLFRFSLPRATVPSCLILLLCWYLMLKEKNLLLFIFSAVFPNFYGGFSSIFLPLTAVSLTYVIKEKRLPYKGLVSTISGVLFGLIISPFFPDNVKFIYFQTTSAGITRSIRGGNEWMSFSPEEFFTIQFPFIAVFLVSLYISAVSEKKMAKDSLSLFFISIPLIIFAYKWRRFIELAVPFVLLFSATIIRDYGNEYLSKIKENSRSFLRYSTPFFFFFFLLLAFTTSQKASKEVSSDTRNPYRYRNAAKWLYENAIGMPVYLTDWDDYPELFFYNSKNRYLIGLDPAFLYIYDKRMYKIWIEINSGRYKGDLKRAFTEIFKTP
ncbi:MAG: hypothetical protein D6734_10530, partial [Candidatus Schekmanbacteria bacterium]